MSKGGMRNWIRRTCLLLLGGSTLLLGGNIVVGRVNVVIGEVVEVELEFHGERVLSNLQLTMRSHLHLTR